MNAGGPPQPGWACCDNMGVLAQAMRGVGVCYQVMMESGLEGGGGCELHAESSLGKTTFGAETET